MKKNKFDGFSRRLRECLNLRWKGVLMVTFAVNASSQAQEVTFFTPRTVRIVKQAPDTSKETGLSLVVTAQPQNVKITEKTVGNVTTYTSSELIVTVDKGVQTVTFSDKNGKILMQEGKCAFNVINDGPDKGRYKVKQAYMLDKDEPIYGVGLLQNEKMSQRGEHRLMVQSNLEDYAHFWQSIKGYGVYWDNYSPTRIDDGNEGLQWESQVGTKVDYYFMYGGNADGVIKEMRSLTGKVPMLPLWTYGFHQSRERYKTSKELLEVVDTYKKTGVPFDGIIQDWQYWGNNYLWNAMEFLNDDFRDYRHMIDHVHGLGKHMSISIWASFGPQTKAYRELKEKGLLYSFETWPQSGLPDWPPRMDYPSGVVCYDPYSQEARDIYWNNLKRLKEAGVDAWWMDSTDPDHHSYKESDLDEVRPITNPVTGKDYMGSYRSVRNAFPLCTVEGIYNKQRAEYPNQRVFILTRSYFAGQQRTGANTWSGDVSSSWDSFRKQVPICLNYTLTANPNVNTDLGGFFANAYNKSFGDNSATRNPLYQELYIRWMQFGTFCPMMRSHGTEVFRELYYFGKSGEPVYDALLDAVKLRYQILPYIYSQSWQVSQNDDSFMRALMMDFPEDKEVWNNNREYMFGPAFLVCPVVNALYTPETANTTDPISGWDNNKKSLFQEGFKVDWSENKKYEVYLPAYNHKAKGKSANEAGAFYNFYTGERLTSGKKYTVDAPINRMPIFVREGSIVPMCMGNVDHANIADWKELTIAVYPGADSSFTLYEDEGDGYGYEKGQRSTINLTWSDKAHTLTIGQRQGTFPGMLQQRQFTVKLPDGTSRTVNYNGKKVSVKL
ncbi:MAG: glycoside hydrolase family 31 protein [Bacteroidaceae bacterium]|nr:glycoside hydrolase family 31 protein [Bacteroidaceae bacterium]